jgi:hypothetical protein
VSSGLVTKSNITFNEDISGVLGLGFPRLSTITASDSNGASIFIAKCFAKYLPPTSNTILRISGSARSTLLSPVRRQSHTRAKRIFGARSVSICKSRSLYVINGNKQVRLTLLLSKASTMLRGMTFLNLLRSARSVMFLAICIGPFHWRTFR